MRAANGVAMRAMCCERIVGAFLGAEVRSGERACVCATGACEREYASIATTTLFAAQPPSILYPRTTPENSEKVEGHRHGVWGVEGHRQAFAPLLHEMVIDA